MNLVFCTSQVNKRRFSHALNSSPNKLRCEQTDARLAPLAGLRTQRAGFSAALLLDTSSTAGGNHMDKKRHLNYTAKAVDTQ